MSKLTDRGIAYSSNTPRIETTETENFARFRGLSYNISRPLNVPQSQPKLLKYRGVVYTTENGKISTPNTSNFPASVVPAFN
ncbi:DUF4278 domain-containing protein [Limnoraphis robusta]|uniref:DUF4278 domain-containing protein n=1 Tax=Limnoraphis robusta CCNP1315 TaxID=3110306 RepID=A0ABU5U3X3_9CYAN|nr:DUF4278 domain-containing protein [Limnoraphis robusta]MEA5521343.1 DUF4278 domain-containing protein [Limnoraphis robusta CCNP1315]MEA5547980.1 DUF4278 domain-containing protein [Limnoraphis robusta CCNP1324]